MNAQRTIFAAVVAVVFLFAGYNLYNYFAHQSEIQERKDRQAQKRIEAKKKKQLAQIERQKKAETEQAKRQEKIDKERAEQKAKKDEARRLAAEKEGKEQQANIALKKKITADRLKAQILKARTPRSIEGIPEETIDQLNSVAARYIRDKPGEFSGQKFGPKSLGSHQGFVKLLQEDTNTLMLYAAVSQDLDILQALLDIGLDINSANKAGYTPLMFASAYNTPEIVAFLVGKGADISAKAYIQDMNALHVASLINPKPDVIDALLKAGISIESKTENEFTPLLLAASDNKNLEVAERLALKGADKGAYDNKGRTAFKIVEARLRGEGDRYISISEEVDKRVMLNTIQQ